MNKYLKIAFSCYFVIMLMGGFMGIRYILAGEIRPHHLEIIGVESWNMVVSEYKVMLLMLMKGAGLGYLTMAVALVVVLFGPFQEKERWSIWALLAICTVQLFGRLVNIAIASTNNQNSAPIELLAIAFGLVLVAFLCSLKMPRPDKQSHTNNSNEKYALFSQVCYALVAVMALITAVVYSISSQAMPYHLDALSIPDWSSLEKGYQVIMLTYMRGAGLGFLTTVVAIGLFLFALRKNTSNWMRWGIMVVSLTQALVMSYVVMTVRSLTPGNPPIIPLAAAVVLSIVGFLMPISKKKIKAT